MKNSDYRGLWEDAGELKQMLILSLLETPKTRYEIAKNLDQRHRYIYCSVDKLEKRGFIKVDRDVVNKKQGQVCSRTEEGVRYMQEYFKRLSLSFKNMSTSE